MRKIILLLFFGIVFPAHAYFLYVGDYAFWLNPQKVTTPSLNFLVNGTRYYVPMQNGLDCELKMKHNDAEYSSCANYRIENGRLTWASPNVYLESSNQQYIDTMQNLTTTTTISAKFYIISPVTNYIFGAQQVTDADSGSAIDYNGLYAKSTLNGSIIMEYGGKLATSIYVPNQPHITLNQYIDNNTMFFTINDNSYSMPVMTECPAKTILIMATRGTDTDNIRYYGSRLRTYYFTIRDGDTVVRQMVPVPAGLRIGDYIVPANGMWDIVEQKFYGNSGTGDFIYGVDE